MHNLPCNLWQVEHTWRPRHLDATDVQEEASSAYSGLLCVICSHITCNELLNGMEEAHTGIIGRKEDAHCAWLVRQGNSGSLYPAPQNSINEGQELGNWEHT